MRLFDRRPAGSPALILCIASAVAVTLNGCSEQALTPTEFPSGQNPPTQGVIVSEPVTMAAGPATASTIDAAYVTAVPGTFGDDAVAVRIRNATADGPPTGPIPVRDGGFDPVAIRARAADRLELTIARTDGESVRVHTNVPSWRPPIVVRTDLPQDTAVALGARPVVIFSEPIDTSTLSTAALQLRNGGDIVSGTIAPVPGSPFAAEFAPDEPLEPSTSYELAVTQQIRDLDGHALEFAVSVTFRTQSAPPVVGTLVMSNVTTGAAFDVDGYRLTIDGRQFPYINAFPLPFDLNDSVVVELPTGDRAVELADVASNCATSDATRRTITITEGAVARLSWALTCTPPPDLRSVRLVFSKSIAPTGLREHPSHIHVMNGDGTGAVQLTHGPASDYAPAVSPDAKHIAFIRDPDGGHPVSTEVLVMNFDGTNVRALLQAFRPGEPAWSPDGTRLALAVGPRRICEWCGGDIWIVGANGSGPVSMVVVGEWPAWSPDGRRLAMTRHSDDPRGLHTWTMDADGTRATRLQPGMMPVWSPDGRRIAYIGGTGVHVMDADGSHATRLVPLRPDPWTDLWFVDDWSVDGEWIALSRGWIGVGPWRNDIYLARASTGELLRVTADGVSSDPKFVPDT